MEISADQVELFEFPVTAERTKARTPFRQLMDAIREHGTLIPQAMVASALELSTQRVSQLVGTGQLASVTVDGRKYVPAAALELFLTEERKVGRPVKYPGFVEIVRRVSNGSKESRK